MEDNLTTICMRRKNESLIHSVDKPSSEIFIYGLIDPDSKEIKYIGLATTGFDRLRQHWRSVSKSSRTAVKSWLKKLKRNNKVFDIVYLEYFDKDTELLDEAEQFWIMYFKSIGSKLLNHDLGGRNNRGKFRFEETRKLHGERIKEALDRPGIKEHLSELTKKQWADPEMRAKMSIKTNINKDAQEKSRQTCRKVRGAKFIDDLGNSYECANDFAIKWNISVAKVRDALYKEIKLVGRTLTRTTPIKPRNVRH